MGDMLIFTTTDGETFGTEVAAGTGRDHLQSFRLGQKPFSDEWIEIDDRRLIRRDAIVFVRLQLEDDEPGGVAFG